MKTFLAIVLVSLLGFFGCSGGNDGTRAVTGQAILVAPYDITDTMKPTYKWTQVLGATRYQLLVEDINGTALIEKWYTAEETGCSSEEGLCSVKPDIDVPGGKWKVLACAGEECGFWSDEMQFSFTIGDQTRFTDNGDGTVSTNKSTLMWSKDANICGAMTWDEASSCCADLNLAGHSDWRLPSISELNGLIDASQSNPALSPGHPFTNVQTWFYWSSTSGMIPGCEGCVYIIDISLDSINWSNKYHDLYVWPVRSGN